MAYVQLDRLRGILQQINASAQDTATIFARIEQILRSMETARFSKDAQAYAAAAEQARRYAHDLDRLAAAQRRAATAGPTGGLPVTSVPGGVALPGIDPTSDRAARAAAGLAERQRLFNESFGLSAQSMQRANKVLSAYGLNLENLSRVYIDPISRTREFTFTGQDFEGVIKKASFAVDRFGNIVGQSGTRFRSFEDMITRNISKVLEWAIAVGVVYGAFSQLGRIIQIMRDINEEMSDISIATQRTGEDLTQLFDEAATAAKITGTSLTGVLSVYDDAIKTTSAIRNETERYASANDLLVDALTFARLTGLDVNEAMDILVGSLRQLGPVAEDVSRGVDPMVSTFAQADRLLDVWAFTAQNATLSMRDLAETFAITGAAAQSAGLSMEDLSAVAAVMAETTRKSATEVGNTIRRLILTMQSETGQDVLRQYGISLEKITIQSGELTRQTLGFSDVIADLAAKYRAGVISDAALQDIGYALGGGARGGADIQALIKNYDQVLEKSDAARRAADLGGVAAAQLDAKYRTLNTSINKLDVSFQSLVQTLGTDGGLLTFLTDIIDAFSGVIRMLDDVVDTLGPATTRMLAFTVALAALSRYRPDMFQAMGGFGGPRPTGAAWTTLGGGIIPPVVGAPTRNIGQAFKQNPAAFAPAAIYATSALMAEGGPGNTENLARAGGIIGGAIVGTLTGAGPTVGAIIGDAVSSIIIGEVQKAKLRAADIEFLSDEELRELARGLEEQLGTLAQPAGIFDKWFGDPREVEERIKKLREALLGEGGVEAGIAILGEGRPQRAAARPILEDYIRTQRELQERGIPTGAGEGKLRELISERDRELRTFNQRALANTEQLVKRQRELLEQYIGGDVTRKQYADFVEGADDATTRVGMLYQQLGDDVGSSLEDMQMKFAGFKQETRDELIAVVTEINNLQDALTQTENVTEQQKLQGALQETEGLLRRLYEAAVKFSQQELEPFKFEGFTDFSEYTKGEVDQIVEEARRMQEAYFEFLKIPVEVYQEGWEKIVLSTKEGWSKVEDVYGQFLSATKKTFDDAKKAQDQFNLERLRDLSPEQFPELQQRVKYWETYLSQVPGYPGETQPFNLVLGENNEFRQLMTTQEALRFAIEDLTEVEKKQLEGMWNIPEGATVMVPLQSLFYNRRGGGGGVPNLPGATFGGEATGIDKYAGLLSQGFEQPATKMDTAGDKMMEAASSMLQIGPTVYEATKNLETGGASMVGVGQDIYDVAGPAQPAEATQGLLEQLRTDWAAGWESLGINIKDAIQAGVSAITADITINIPPIQLDGEQVTRSVSLRQSRKLQSAARSRGFSGGGVIQ